ncbi:MAG: exodeoxyribonuclease I [Pseudomonadota bacterium]
MTPSFFWHDYETFGADPRWDRPVQFAGVRTDLELNVIDKPVELYAKPAPDYLPHPEACLITGITPQQAEAQGDCESAFIAGVNEQMSVPGTCSVGYNSLRFDDAVTRHTLFRNLQDPYAREYGQGRSRWDLIDAVRTAYALRPDGIQWPTREDGHSSFRLEDLASANSLEQESAHDAMSDVRATIALAKLLKQRQPRLFRWLFDQRGKTAVRPLLGLGSLEPRLHVSGMFGASRANLGMVLPLSVNQSNSNEVLMIDLSSAVEEWVGLAADEVRRRQFMRTEDLPRPESRPGIKTLHLNRCPVVLPVKMLTPELAARAGLDLDLCAANLKFLLAYEHKYPGALADLLHAVLTREDPEVEDPDVSLYSGGFLSSNDRTALDALLRMAPRELASARPVFEDERLDELLFRYRARNYPTTLTEEEQSRWRSHCARRLADGEPGLQLAEFRRLIASLITPESTPKVRDILQALSEWGDSLEAFVMANAVQPV